MEFAHEQELNALLRDKLAEKGRIVLAIDGRCGAGKSTLADRLAAQCNGRVIRADDFSSGRSSARRNGWRSPAATWTGSA